MKYPEFIKKGDVIGICAPSAGVGHKLESYEKSIDSLHKRGYLTRETASVRNNSEVSTDALSRAKELIEIYKDSEVKTVWAAAGGDFMIEMLPYVDIEALGANPKWVMGASDPSSLLYWITTHLDIATFYGCNAGSFDQDNWHESLVTAEDFWSGHWHIQNSFDKWQRRANGDYCLDTDVFWENLNEKHTVAKGRLIGGCLDVLRDMLGTPRDCTKEFLNRYKDEEILWYFDTFSLTAEDFYRVLLQMKAAGWFERVSGVVCGRVAFEKSFTQMTYQKALQKVFGEDILLVFNADIGHTVPRIFMVNGARAEISVTNGRGSINLIME